jgi:hypothetical protein
MPHPAGCANPWAAPARRYSPTQIGQVHSAHSTSFDPPLPARPPMFTRPKPAVARNYAASTRVKKVEYVTAS